MTGQDIQDRLDAIVNDLQTKGKGKTVQLMFRNQNGSSNVKPLSSDVNGVVDVNELGDIDIFINDLKGLANGYAQFSAPVTAASEAFRLAQVPHQALMDAAKVSRDNLSVALEADAGYQAAKTALDAARADANYIASGEAYKINNVSENYSELQQAKGKYIGV